MVIISVFVSLYLVIWLIQRVDYKETEKLLLSCNKKYLLLAFLFMTATPFCCVIRWTGILKSQKNIKISYWQAFNAIMLANVLNSFLPSKGGDLVKAAFIRKQCGLSLGVGTVILERLIDFFILGLLGILGFVGSKVYWGLYIGSALLIAVSVIFTIFVFCSAKVIPGKLRVLFSDIKSVVINWLNKPSAIIQSITGSLCNWFFAGLTICSLGLALSDQANSAYLLSVYPAAILVGLLPFSVSGIGIRDAAFVFLLSTQMTREEATLVGLGYTALGYWFIAVFSLSILLFKVVTLSVPLLNGHKYSENRGKV